MLTGTCCGVLWSVSEVSALGSVEMGLHLKKKKASIEHKSTDSENTAVRWLIYRKRERTLLQHRKMK